MDDITFDTKYGKFAVSPTADAKFLDQFRRGVFHQEHDITLLGHFLSNQSVVVDIGAYIGTMAIPLARYAKHVHAFEPVAATRAILEKNVMLNGVKNVTVYPVALGDRQDERFAHVDAGADTAQYTVLEKSSGPEDVSVSVRTLDEMLESADLIKVDAEGMEYEVLQGARKLIEHSKPVIFSEINFGQLWLHGSSPSVLQRALSDWGYQLYIPLGEGKIGKVWNLGLITGILRPAFFFHIPRNYAFDVLALRAEHSTGDIRVESAAFTFLWALKTQLRSRLR